MKSGPITIDVNDTIDTIYTDFNTHVHVGMQRIVNNAAFVYESFTHEIEWGIIN